VWALVLRLPFQAFLLWMLWWLARREGQRRHPA
jgi:uncharacterized membrane protein